MPVHPAYDLELLDAATRGGTSRRGAAASPSCRSSEGYPWCAPASEAARHPRAGIRSPFAMPLPPSTQMVLREGYCEFNFGQPDPDCCPLRTPCVAPRPRPSIRYGPDLLAYGAPEGAWPLLAWIRDRIEQREGVAVSLEECIGTAGNSDAIDQVCTLFTRPGDIAFVESPTYHLGLRILQRSSFGSAPGAHGRGGPARGLAGRNSWQQLSAARAARPSAVHDPDVPQSRLA